MSDEIQREVIVVQQEPQDILVIQTAPPDVLLVETEVAPETIEIISQGPQGPAGPGVPSDGDTDQVLVKASEAPFDTRWQTAPRIISPNPEPILNHRFTLPTRPLGDIIWNSVMVYVDLTPADMVDGVLIGDREYVVQDHNGNVVPGTSEVQIRNPESLDGYYAVVSYLSW